MHNKWILNLEDQFHHSLTIIYCSNKLCMLDILISSGIFVLSAEDSKVFYDVLCAIMSREIFCVALYFDIRHSITKYSKI